MQSENAIFERNLRIYMEKIVTLRANIIRNLFANKYEE